MQHNPKLWLLPHNVLWAGKGTNRLCKPCVTPSLCCCVRIGTPPHHQKRQTMPSQVTGEFLVWWLSEVIGKKALKLKFRWSSPWWPSLKLPPLTRWSSGVHAFSGKLWGDKIGVTYSSTGWFCRISCSWLGTSVTAVLCLAIPNFDLPWGRLSFLEEKSCTVFPSNWNCV